MIKDLNCSKICLCARLSNIWIVSIILFWFDVISQFFTVNSILDKQIKTVCLSVCLYNLEQSVADKFTKLSKTGYFMECFTADFLQFYTKKRQNLAYGSTAGYSPSNPSISRIFLKIS